MVERQSNHRQTVEKESLDASVSIAKRGQNFAFILSLIGIVGALFLAYIGQVIPASIIGGGTLIGLASLFIRGTSDWKKRKKDKNDSK